MGIPHAAFFGRSVMYARKRQHGMREELAARIGVRMDEFMAIERGEALPTSTTMVRILCALNMTPDWLFFLNDPDTNERMDGIVRMVRCLDATGLDSVEQCLIKLASRRETTDGAPNKAIKKSARRTAREG